MSDIKLTVTVDTAELRDTFNALRLLILEQVGSETQRRRRIRLRGGRELLARKRVPPCDVPNCHCRCLVVTVP